MHEEHQQVESPTGQAKVESKRGSLLMPTTKGERRDSLNSTATVGSIRSTHGWHPASTVSSAFSMTSTMDVRAFDVHGIAKLVLSGRFFFWLGRRWREFSLFGVTKDDTPRVWGNRVKSNGRRVSTDGGPTLERAKTKQLNRMVTNHTHHDEMRLQLRDERVNLTYLDAFGTDHNHQPDRHVRVFSFGATLLEYLKIFLGMWAFIVSLTVVAFWEVIMGPDHLKQQLTLMLVDLLVDFIYMACLALQLRTTILDVSSGREYCARKKIVTSNLSSSKFWADVMSCVPLILLSGIFNGSSFMRWIALLKACRGWRIFRTPPEHRFVPSTLFQLVQLSCSIMMGGHLIACIWFMLVHEGEDTMRHHVPWHNQAYRDCLTSGPTASCFWKLYTVSINQGIYLLMGIECTAYSANEHFFLTLCAPAGALVHAYMLGQIILLIQRRGALETKQNEHTLAIQEAMRILGLPPNLQMRIITFFTYERIHRSGRLVAGLFTDLSPQLRFELQLHCYLDLVGGSGLFRQARPRVIREIVVSLTDIIFLPGDWICRYGDYGDSMYFIVNGECAVIHKDTVTELRVLTNGAYFGEVALLTGVTRTAYVRANSFCIMAHLTKEKFRPIVEKWPEETTDVLVGHQKEEDRMKIKAETSRNYALPGGRRTSIASQQSNGRNPVTAMVQRMQQESPNGLRSSNDSVASEALLTEADEAPRSQIASPQLASATAINKLVAQSHQGPDIMKLKKEIDKASVKNSRSDNGYSPKPMSATVPVEPSSTAVEAFDTTSAPLSTTAFAEAKNNAESASPGNSASPRSSSSSEDIPYMSLLSTEGEGDRAGAKSPSAVTKKTSSRDFMEWRLSVPLEAPPPVHSQTSLPGAPEPSIPEEPEGKGIDHWEKRTRSENPGFMTLGTDLNRGVLRTRSENRGSTKQGTDANRKEQRTRSEEVKRVRNVAGDMHIEDATKPGEDLGNVPFIAATSSLIGIQAPNPLSPCSRNPKTPTNEPRDLMLKMSSVDADEEAVPPPKTPKSPRSEKIRLNSKEDGVHTPKGPKSPRGDKARGMVAMEVTAANSLLKAENELLRKVRHKLKEVARHVSRLQDEVYDQEELLQSTTLDVRTWAAEAAREAVSQEVLKYQSYKSETDWSSMRSFPDTSLPLATPFT